MDQTIAIDKSGARRLYLTCVLAASAGRNTYFIAAAWIAVEGSRNATILATLLCLGSVAELLTTNTGGMLVDRFDRRLICAVCDLLRIALLFLTILCFSYTHSLSVIFVSWIFYAIVDRTYLTSLQAVVPSLVGQKQLVSFNSISYVGMQAGNLLSSLVGGYILSAISRGACLLFAISCFVISLLAMLILRDRAPFPRAKSKPVAPTQFRRVLPTHLTLGPLLASAFLFALIYAMGMLVNVLSSTYVLQELRGTALEFGYLEAGWAAGSIAGCCILLFILRARTAKYGILFHLALSGIVLSGFLLFDHLLVSVCMMTVLGVSYNAARILIDTKVQQAIPGSALGVARSQIHTVCVAVGLLVYGIIAVLGDAVLPSTAFGLFGLVMIGAAGVVAFSRRKLGGPMTGPLLL